MGKTLFTRYTGYLRLLYSPTCIMGFGCLCYLILTMHSPISVLDWQKWDDEMFMQRGVNIINTGWLGKFDQFTLAKGPIYSVVLAVGFLLGLPVTLLHSLLYMFSVGFFSISLKKIIMNEKLVIMIFLILLFHPAMIPLRVIRDYVIGDFILIMLGCIFLSLYYVRDTKKRLIWTLIAGVSFGLFWYTREDGVWLLPGMLFLLLMVCKEIWSIEKSIKSFIGVFFIFFISFVSVGTLIKTTNKIVYGKYIAVDFKEHNFVEVLNLLQGVKSGPIVPFAPVPEKVRNIVYKISPSFYELKSYLELENGFNSKENPFCKLWYPNTCGDYAAGAFMWALRDAVASKGYYSSPNDSAMFYRRIANEIRKACGNKTITCVNPIISFMPAITVEQAKKIPAKYLDAFNLLIFKTAIPTSNQPSSYGTQLDNFLNRPLKTENINTLESNFNKNERNILINIYRFLLPIIGIGGVFAYFAIAFTKVSGQQKKIFLICSALWLMIIARVTILVLVDISSFIAVYHLYMTPVYPLFCAAGLLSIYNFILIFNNKNN